MGNFRDFLKISRNINFSFFEILTLLLGAVRVFSGVANLASNSHFSNPCSFRDMTFFVIFSKIFKNLDFKKFTKLEITISAVRLSQGTLRSCEFSKKPKY